MSCRTGCRTGGHSSWGECLRASNIQMSPGDAASNKSMTSKKWDAELQAYRDARAQGIQPSGTSMAKIRQAVEISNKTGVAFGA